MRSGPYVRKTRGSADVELERPGDPRFSSDTAVDTLWWQTFNDPTLDALVDLANRENLPLQTAGLRIVEARARLGVATGQQYPQLQVALANATAVGLSEHAPNTSRLDAHFVDYQVGFDALWEMDFWGKYRRGIEAEAANLVASVTDYRAALVSLTAEVARTYAAVRTAEVLIDLAEHNAALQEQGLNIAESRFRNGATSELDVSQAATLLWSTRASIPQLQISLEQARNALSTLLGRPTHTLNALLMGPKEIPNAPAKVALSIPAEMLRRRPDIRSAEMRAVAQCARIGVAKAALYPSFSLLGTIGIQTSSGAGVSFNPFSDGSPLTYQVGPRIFWPFFNYGRLENGVRIEDARFQQSLTDYRNTVLTAAQEVEDALAGFLNSQQAAVFQRESVQTAERSQEIAMVQYKEGAVDFQRVLDAARSLLQQQNALAQARSAVATNLIAIYKALGGGWETYAGEPIVSESVRADMMKRTNWGDMLSTPRDLEETHPAAGNNR